MKKLITSFGAITLSVFLAACGGGGDGGGSGGGGAPSNTPPPSGGSNNADKGAWLTFSPVSVDLSVLPNQSQSFKIRATSTKIIPGIINIGIIDSTGVINPHVEVSAISPMVYEASMTTNASLSPGIHTGNFEVRVCHDDPLTCAQPVEGSPWQLPYKIEVKTSN